MQLSALARYVRRLEETSSRTALVGILAELFRATPPDEIAPTTYLLQGRLAPVFVPLEMGMGPTLVTEAIARVGDRSLRSRLERAYNETSDLGLIGATLWEGGINGVDALGIRVGNPVRPALAERLPSASQ